MKTQQKEARENPIVTEFFGKVQVHLKPNPHGRCAVESELNKAIKATLQNVLDEMGERKSVKELFPEMDITITNKNVAFAVTEKNGYNTARREDRELLSNLINKI